MNTNQFKLTTDQLAQAFGVTRKILTNNFQRHRDGFIEGTHYLLLQGEDLKVFLSEKTVNIVGLPERSSNVVDLSEMPANVVDDLEFSVDVADLPERPTNVADLSGRSANKIRNLYLWTLKGAFEHAWLLKSPQAKQAYEKMVDQALQGSQTTALLQENITLRQQAELYLHMAEKALQVNGPGMENLYETGEVEALAGSVRQLMKEIQVVLKAKKIDTDQLLELVRKLEKKMAVLEEHAASSDEKMLTTLDTVGEHYQLLQNFQQQAQAMLPPARQIAAPKA